MTWGAISEGGCHFLAISNPFLLCGRKERRKEGRRGEEGSVRRRKDGAKERQVGRWKPIFTFTPLLASAVSRLTGYGFGLLSPLIGEPIDVHAQTAAVAAGVGPAGGTGGARGRRAHPLPAHAAGFAPHEVAVAACSRPFVKKRGRSWDLPPPLAPSTHPRPSPRPPAAPPPLPPGVRGPAPRFPPAPEPLFAASTPRFIFVDPSRAPFLEWIFPRNVFSH